MRDTWSNFGVDVDFQFRKGSSDKHVVISEGEHEITLVNPTTGDILEKILEIETFGWPEGELT